VVANFQAHAPFAFSVQEDRTKQKALDVDSKAIHLETMKLQFEIRKYEAS
jgi:hypothetical protein